MAQIGFIGSTDDLCSSHNLRLLLAPDCLVLGFVAVVIVTVVVVVEVAAVVLDIFNVYGEGKEFGVSYGAFGDLLELQSLYLYGFWLPFFFFLPSLPK